ncbi:hypothetical protein K7X08_010002 [Anisodus acutangulus]|uniref:Uncharacterized protein n=1 Tax=Anisodus acutangulus TaxID=402998 RepID=A0A9Q1N1Y0_9SOLA|nr:hypothetical protein K7X08_010002 [Anisodus acutangulus]
MSDVLQKKVLDWFVICHLMRGIFPSISILRCCKGRAEIESKMLICPTGVTAHSWSKSRWFFSFGASRYTDCAIRKISETLSY